MDTGIDKAQLLHYKAIVLEHLSDPAKLRVTTVAALVLAAVFAGYMPLSKRIQEAQRRLAAERERNEQIMDVEKLRKQVAAYRDRIGDSTDTNEWVRYLLAGLDRFNVKLRGMESREPRRVGPYRTVTLEMEIEGGFAQLRGFVEWMERSERLLRVDSVRFERSAENLLLKTTVLGLVPKHARTTG
jgi:type II secretory pathway component PulM